jgi:hypothetical protein
MIAYIGQIAKGILGLADETEPEKHRAILLHATELAEEMRRLDPREFLPEVR